MKVSEYIGGQFANPRGIFGKIACLIMNRMNRIQYEGALAELYETEGMRVLDIGFGNGYLVGRIYETYNCQVRGIDISEDMRRAATERNKRGVETGDIHLSIGDVCQMGYGNDEFDFVTSVNTVYFWKDLKSGLSEVFRVLRYGGSFVNVIYSKEWLKTLAYTKKGFSIYEPEEIAKCARDCGFVDVEIKVLKKGKSFAICCGK